MISKGFPIQTVPSLCLDPLKSAGSLSLTVICVRSELTYNVLIVLNKETFHFSCPDSVMVSRVSFTKLAHCIASQREFSDDVMRFAILFLV